MHFDFTIPDHPEFSFLSPQDLHFFYYDVEYLFKLAVLDNDSWDKILEEFGDKVDIKSCQSKDIPKEAKENTIRFTKGESGEAADFFRHLRNAFSHHRIYRHGNTYYLQDSPKDFDGNRTMIGQIEVQLLKEICYKFYEIDSEIRDDYEKAFNLKLDLPE